MTDFTPYVLIGAGGTGSHFIGPALAYLNSWHTNQGGDWTFTVIDGDSYEAKNQERQMFPPEYIGLNKADAMKSTYNQYPIISVPYFIGQEDLNDIMEEGSVVFLGVDNMSVRSLVEQRAYELKNVVVLNAGNERHTGSVQIWIRENGENKTPPISFLHPEIKYESADDRAYMSCMQAAQLPGGEQLIIANMAAAQHMMTALWRYHTGVWNVTEIQFDLQDAVVEHLDYRGIPNWEKDRPVEISARAPSLNPA